ncbi:hypothetical protein [Nocardioides acrostichi]|uniref:Transmembrane protein n=1 Tax=Nocardioides acrostichi TaxID=2784339 RepID=A0A930Y5S1_9ACTN|nr:hypothetical protein [Nocardioides acrostichi]MBF4160177.1 hypothetical protein [Nocardioides acrostichi]
MITRLSLGAVGLAGLAYGAWLLLGTGWSNIVAAVEWLAGGVLLHDGVVAPLSIVVAALALRVVPSSVRARVAAAAIVIGTTATQALPLFDRPGAKPDNPTLLPRDYVTGWLVIVALVVVVSAALVLLDRVRARRS